MAGEYQRSDVRYRGRVQGVGFRYTTRQIASSYAVTGFVRNLPDGGVRVVVEGPPQEVKEFLDEIQRRLGDYIEAVDTKTTSATGEFSGFEIAF